MLPLSLTAALAAWLRILRMWRLPPGQRVLLFIPALSSSPGHAPTHEERFLGEAKVAAVAPTSAMICCAESGPKVENTRVGIKRCPLGHSAAVLHSRSYEVP